MPFILLRQSILGLTVFITSTFIALAMNIQFDDKLAFLTATGATTATGALPDLGRVGAGPLTIGDVTIQSASGDLFVGGPDWTTRLPGNEIAISGLEHLDIDINITSLPYAFGFDFVEPQFDPNINSSFVDSTFMVALVDGGSTVDSFTFNAPNDIAAFVGVWSDTSFDEVQIREITGSIGNEFFGEIYTGSVPMPISVPEAGSTLALLGLAIMGLMRFGPRT